MFVCIYVYINQLFSPHLRLVYLTRKGVTFAIENPTTSLLFRYKPLRDTWSQSISQSCIQSINISDLSRQYEFSQ